MKILVIGGSYFFGRVFVMEAAKEHEITVVNRGTYDMSEFGVRQLTGDRAEQALWQSVTEDYDVLVDFCAYRSGDIANVLDNLKGHIRQYIFISTVDVYQRGLPGYKDEHTPLERRAFAGDAGEYIAGKVALEQELCRHCEKSNLSFTVLRPTILYGPFNYAPRESVFIQLMVQQRLLPRITDADGQFQFTYVKDAAAAIIKCLGNESAYGQGYNLCGDETVTYGMFADVLSKAAHAMEEERKQASAKQKLANQESTEQKTTNQKTTKQLSVKQMWEKQESLPEIREILLTVQSAAEQGLPLPFPVTKAETELYSNEKSKAELGMEYVSLEEGMARTCRAFWGVYTD